jgi:polyphosphate glucokinase
MKALGIDIGGSALKGAPVDTQTGRLLGERYKVPTPKPVTPQKMAKIVRSSSAATPGSSSAGPWACRSP